MMKSSGLRSPNSVLALSRNPSGELPVGFPHEDGSRPAAKAPELAAPGESAALCALRASAVKKRLQRRFAAQAFASDVPQRSRYSTQAARGAAGRRPVSSRCDRISTIVTTGWTGTPVAEVNAEHAS